MGATRSTRRAADRAAINMVEWLNAHETPARSDHCGCSTASTWRLRSGVTYPAATTPGRPATSLCALAARQHLAKTAASLQAQADAPDDIDGDGATLDATHVKTHSSAIGARHQPTRAEKGCSRARSLAESAQTSQIPISTQQLPQKLSGLPRKIPISTPARSQKLSAKIPYPLRKIILSC